MDTVRIDKWLWAARFFKTRVLAKKACELGRVLAQQTPVKPAHEVHIGEKLRVTNDSGDFQVEVLALSDMRGPAAVARTLYSESEESRIQREKLAAERKAETYFPVPQGRPTKRDRRRIIQFRGRG